MTTITQFMTADHARCDEHFAAAEAAVDAGAWGDAEARFSEFDAAMKLHFAREESELFPAFEARTGFSAGPTEVMRGEHARMNELLTAMRGALSRRAADDYLGLSETLLIMMRQHNVKEEQILYPAADRALGTDAITLADRIRAMNT